MVTCITGKRKRVSSLYLCQLTWESLIHYRIILQKGMKWCCDHHCLLHRLFLNALLLVLHIKHNFSYFLSVSESWRRFSFLKEFLTFCLWPLPSAIFRTFVTLHGRWHTYLSYFLKGILHPRNRVLCSLHYFHYFAISINRVAVSYNGLTGETVRCNESPLYVTSLVDRWYRPL